MRAKHTKTFTRSDLSDCVRRKVNLSKADSSHLVDSLIAIMGDKLAAGEDVKLSGFGSLVVKEQKARMGRNPKTGVEVPIAPRRAVTFKPSPKLSTRVDSAMKAPASKIESNLGSEIERNGRTKRWVPNTKVRSYARL